MNVVDQENNSFLVYTIDAFAKTSSQTTGSRNKPITSTRTGNPAGFVDLRAQRPHLSDETMLAIAAKVGFSETAFMYSSSEADFRVRFFTPSDEVDLCGHATIGLFSGMYQLGLIEPGSYVQKTKAGKLRVEIDEKGAVLMEQASPVFDKRLSLEEKAEVAKSLGLSPEALHDSLPCQKVSTGLMDLLVPLKTKEALAQIQPNFEHITDLSRQHEVVGYHVFYLDPESEAPLKAQCRNFAPLYAIPEEAATGTSSGALAAYLQQQGYQQAKDFKFKQGVEMDCPSEIMAHIDENGTVWVGGMAANLKSRMVSL